MTSRNSNSNTEAFKLSTRVWKRERSTGECWLDIVSHLKSFFNCYNTLLAITPKTVDIKAPPNDTHNLTNT